MGTGTGRAAIRVSVEVEGAEQLVTVEPLSTGGSLMAVCWSGKAYEVDVSRLRQGRLSVIIPAAGHTSHEVSGYEAASGDVVLGIGGRTVKARVSDGRRSQTTAAVQIEGDHAVVSPMPGRLVRVLVGVGETITAGQGLAVVEAMKMENEVSSPSAGVVREVRADVGKSVEAGSVLVVVSAGANDD